MHRNASAVRSQCERSRPSQKLGSSTRPCGMRRAIPQEPRTRHRSAKFKVNFPGRGFRVSVRLRCTRSAAGRIKSRRCADISCWLAGNAILHFPRPLDTCTAGTLLYDSMSLWTALDFIIALLCLFFREFIYVRTCLIYCYVASRRHINFLCYN